MSLHDAIDHLARAKGWHASQWAHGVPDVWTFCPSPKDSDSYVGMWDVYPPNATEPVLLPASTAAIVLLLAVAEFVPIIEVGDTPAQLVAELGPAWHSRTGGAAHLAMVGFIDQLRDEALVLADQWMAGGVGLSSEPIASADLLAARIARCTKCGTAAQWVGAWTTGVRLGYCSDHRPLDGLGDRLAAAIAGGVWYEPPAEFCAGRDRGDGHSPMLWWLLDVWLEGGPNPVHAIRDALLSAWIRATVPCPACKDTPGSQYDGWTRRGVCPACKGRNRVAKPDGTVIA